MIRREFLKRLNIGVSALVLGKLDLSYSNTIQGYGKETKNWLWLHPWHNISDDEHKIRFEKIRSSGIDAIIPNVYTGWNALYKSQHLPVSGRRLERLLPFAKSVGLEVHAWMWSMICNHQEILNKHPDWFAVNRNGESTIEKPAYVNYYRFMCPNHPQVREFVAKTVKELSAYSELDGIHLDYIRYPDVILAEKLQTKYNIIQDKEYAAYDYCYCDICCTKFKEKNGVDIRKTKDPDINKVWRQFRYDSITEIVNDSLIPPARKSGKTITAAVFPNWENVRQQWSKWNVDAVFPMLYHEYYNKGVEWIEAKIIEGKNSIDPSVKLYSGLLVQSHNAEELRTSIKKSLKAGADGVSLFAYHHLQNLHWDSISQLLTNRK